MIRSMMTLGALLVVGGVAQADPIVKKQTVDNDHLIQCMEYTNNCMEYSKLADKRSKNEQVRDFATKVINEGVEAKKKIGEEFKNRKLGAVAGTSEVFRKELARLSDLEGADFDREYMKRMHADLTAAEASINNQIKNGKDETLTAQAKDGHEHAKKCRDEAKKILDSIK